MIFRAGFYYQFMGKVSIPGELWEMELTADHPAKRP